MNLEFYQIGLTGIFLVGVFLVMVPVLLGIGTLLFHCLYRKLIVRKKQKLVVKKEKSEKNKLLFYNVFLPCQIFAFLFLVLMFFLTKIFFSEIFISEESVFFLSFLSCSFGYFYLLYQLVYFVCTKISHSKYYTSWKLWLLVLGWLAMDTCMGFMLNMMLGGWSV